MMEISEENSDAAIDSMSETAQLLLRAPPSSFVMFEAGAQLTNKVAKSVLREIGKLVTAYRAERTQAANVAAHKAAIDEYKATADAESEEKRKKAVRLFEIARAEMAKAEARHAAADLRDARARELGLDPTPPTVRHTPEVHHDFVPIAGTSITRAPELRPPPPVENEKPQAAQSNTVRRGHHDATDFPPDVTLSRQSEEPPEATRIRVGRKGAAA